MTQYRGSMKPCRQCGEVREHYNSIPTCCKVCWRARVAKRRIEKIDEIRAYDRQRSKLPHRRMERALRQQTLEGKALKLKLARMPHARMKAAELQRIRRRNKPEQDKAHYAIYRAIKKGELVRPSKCVRCGSKNKIHAHHDDHTRPLDVMWLCPVCHVRRHQELGCMKIADFRQNEFMDKP